MMGVIIYASDDTEFRVGDFIVMRGAVNTPPSDTSTTFILHCESFPMSEARAWLPMVGYRLIVIPRKGFKGITEGDGIILHRSAVTKRSNFNSPIRALLTWGDRLRAWKAMAETPVPLAESFHRINRIDDIETQRILSRARYMMEEKYAKAALVYGCPVIGGEIKWPKKKNKNDEETSYGFRDSDLYSHEIISNAPEVRNELRTIGKVPEGVKKTPEGILEWL